MLWAHVFVVHHYIPLLGMYYLLTIHIISAINRYIYIYIYIDSFIKLAWRVVGRYFPTVTGQQLYSYLHALYAVFNVLLLFLEPVFCALDSVYLTACNHRRDSVRHCLLVYRSPPPSARPSSGLMVSSLSLAGGMVLIGQHCGLLI